MTSSDSGREPQIPPPVRKIQAVTACPRCWQQHGVSAYNPGKASLCGRVSAVWCRGSEPAVIFPIAASAELILVACRLSGALTRSPQSTATPTAASQSRRVHSAPGLSDLERQPPASLPVSSSAHVTTPWRLPPAPNRQSKLDSCQSQHGVRTRIRHHYAAAQTLSTVERAHHIAYGATVDVLDPWGSSSAPPRPAPSGSTTQVDSAVWLKGCVRGTRQQCSGCKSTGASRPT
jgi:hypothetical protein